MKIRCIAFSQPGPTKIRNEDCVLIAGQIQQGAIRDEQVIQFQGNGTMVFAVADGMAGSPFPHRGSHLLLEILDESFNINSSLHESFRNRMHSVQDTLVARARRGKCHGSAATLAGVALSGDELQVFNVGDSRVYGVAKDTANRLSCDHTELADMIENGEIQPMAVKDAPSSFLEPSSFFMADAMHDVGSINSKTIPLTRFSSLLICTDGLVDVIDDDEIAAANLASIKDIEKLVKLGRSRKGLDDISVLLLHINSP